MFDVLCSIFFLRLYMSAFKPILFSILSWSGARESGWEDSPLRGQRERGTPAR